MHLDYAGTARNASCSEHRSPGTHLNGRGVDVEFLEDSERFLEELVVDGDAGDVGRIVVVESRDVLHDARAVRLHCRQDQQILQIPVQTRQGAEEFCYSLALLCKPYILTYMKDARIHEGYRRTITSHRRRVKTYAQ